LTKLGLEQGEPDSNSEEYGENVFDTLTSEELQTLEALGGRFKADPSASEEASPPRKIQYPILPREFTIGDGPYSSFVSRLRIPPRVGGLGLHNAGQEQDSRAIHGDEPPSDTHFAIDSSTSSNSADEPTNATDSKQALAIEAALWAEQIKTANNIIDGARKSSPLTIAALRAYYLWHHSGLGIAEAANVLRDPPLKTATVAAYIAECVQFGDMAYRDVERLRELVKVLPAQARGRYWRIRKIIEDD
jgi:hypothetical protein